MPQATTAHAAAVTYVTYLLTHSSSTSSSIRALLTKAPSLMKSRLDNQQRSQLGTSNAILNAVRKGATADDTKSAASDGLTLAKLSESGTAKPSDFEPSGHRRLHRKLHQHMDQAPQLPGQ